MTQPEAGSSIGREIGSGLLGAGIAFGCALPPVVHLVTGPLGPVIGGFVAASRARAGARGAVVIGVTLGAALAGLLGGALSIVAGIASPGELPDWFPLTGGAISAFAGVVFVYASALGAGGAFAHAAVEARKGSK